MEPATTVVRLVMLMLFADAFIRAKKKEMHVTIDRRLGFLVVFISSSFNVEYLFLLP